eukprot:SAG31_NODE_313_length_17858_cov_34.811307_1_plen_379_part_00
MGTAKIARKVAAALEAAPSSTIVAVASRQLERAVKFTVEHTNAISHCQFYGDYQELLSDSNVEVVYIPLPTALKKKWVVKACKAGKHVLAGKTILCFCNLALRNYTVCRLSSWVYVYVFALGFLDLSEKPFGSAADVREVTAACASANRQLMDGTMMMHNPRLAEVGSHLQNMEDGIRRINAAFTFNGLDATNIRLDPSLEPAGALGDVGVNQYHCCCCGAAVVTFCLHGLYKGWYAIRMILWGFNWDLPARAVCLNTGDTRKGAALQEVSGWLLYSDGRVGSIESGFRSAHRQSVEFVGAKDFSLTIDDFAIPITVGDVGFSLRRLNRGQEFGTQLQYEHFVVPQDGVSQEIRMVETLSRIAMTVREPFLHIAHPFC